MRTVPTPFDPAPVLPEQPPLPKAIGKYRVLRRLGEGATAEVFLCHDGFKGVDVAIKRVRVQNPESSDGRYSARFFAAEAALVGRLHHPNVAQIYDAVPDPTGPYLVMEYVSGSTLRPYCRANQLLGLEQIVEIGFKCAMALGYVYRQGLIHRDVKPANLLAVQNANGAVIDVKISDFGSVLNLEADTTQIYRVGSLAYMSPEQLDGSTLDARADMYSLGAVLYHLIAGRPPFEAPAQSAMMHQIYHQQPAPLGSLRDGVSTALNASIQRALAKRPADRYANWQEFAQALSALITSQQVPRGQLQGVLDSERFNLLRSLEFFASFGDVELWEVVHRARWQRYAYGHAIYRKGEEGNTFHILAQGELEVYRDGLKVARIGAGSSVGEMVYLAPNPELKRHSADVLVTEPATTISFTPESLMQVSPACKSLFDEAFIRVLVRRLHVAHAALDYPRRIL